MQFNFNSSIEVARTSMYEDAISSFTYFSSVLIVFYNISIMLAILENFGLCLNIFLLFL